MSTRYRLLSFHQSQSSRPAFLSQMRSATHQRDMILRATSAHALQWRYASVKTEHSALPSIAHWVNEVDFASLAHAHAWADEIKQLPILASSLVFYAIGEVLIPKQPDNHFTPPLLVFRFAKKSALLNRTQFSQYWRDTHAPIACASPYLQRYEQVHTIASSDPAWHWDGFTVSCFNGIEEMHQHAQHPAGRAAAYDTKHFLTPTAQPYVVSHKEGQIQLG